MKTLTVAVIILNRNGYENTFECLKSLNSIQTPSFKICVVDNGSRALEGDRIKDAYPNIHLIRLTENKGFAGGANTGINWALQRGFDYIVILNNDTVVERNWLESMMEGFKSGRADFASPLILDYRNRDRIDSAGDVVLPDGSGLSLFRGKSFDFIKKKQRIFSACGAGSIYSRTCLERVMLPGSQFFSEKYFAYFEDIDLALRLNMAGFRGVVFPEAKIYHKGGTTEGRDSSFQIFHTEKNRMLNMLLNFPLFLIPAGEIFYLIRGFLSIVLSFIGTPGKGTRYRRRYGLLAMLRILWQARVWILVHLPEILKEREFRKKQGWVSWKMLWFFHWNLTAAMK
ncbi:MAG: glycosyltransferase family 2 protein [Candidatus Aminicenantes bacterium]|nr:glycosyltransferase family 2 protein [Candidatus Aminicenantes bacterium]